MSAEKLYEYLSYLDNAINGLEDIVSAQASEIGGLRIQLANAEIALLAARRENEDFAARIRMEAEAHIEAELVARVEATLAAERALMQEELEKARKQAAAAAAAAKKQKDDQADLFAQTWSTPKPARIANDRSALILAGKLDSTIDKVQRLLREAGA